MTFSDDISERVAASLNTIAMPLYDQSDLAEFFARPVSTISSNLARVGDGYTTKRPLLPTHRTVDGVPLFTYDRIVSLMAINPKLYAWRQEALAQAGVRAEE